MNIKASFAVLLVIVLALSFVATVESQVSFESKGGQNIAFSELVKGKPTGNFKVQTLATGTVSTLPEAADRWALVIGISDYDGTANDLDYCDDDANDFSSMLVSSYGWASSNILTLTDTEATKANIIAGITWLGSVATADDEVIFFYSGHGSTGTGDPDGDGEAKDECIIPSNFQTAGVIWDGTLATEFSTIPSSRVMFFFDSCYSGGMKDLAGEGNLVLMACGENQLSLESSAWQNGQFTYYFNWGITTQNADSNSDQKVTFEEAFDYAKARCQRQTPTASDGFTNDMLP